MRHVISIFARYSIVYDDDGARDDGVERRCLTIAPKTEAEEEEEERAAAAARAATERTEKERAELVAERAELVAQLEVYKTFFVFIMSDVPAAPRSSDDPHRPRGGGAPLGGGSHGPPMSGVLHGSRIPVIVQDLGDHSVGSTLGDSAEVRPTSGPTTIASSSSSLWNIPVIVQDLDGQSVGSALGRAAGVDFDEDDDGAIVVVPVFGRRGRYTHPRHSNFISAKLWI